MVKIWKLNRQLVSEILNIDYFLDFVVVFEYLLPYSHIKKKNRVFILIQEQGGYLFVFRKKGTDQRRPSVP